MHSRTFLHRLSDERLPGAGEGPAAARHPLGFADVRSVDADRVEPSGSGAGFVTEVSFRRGVVRADAAPQESGADLQVGHASAWRPAPPRGQEATEPVAEEKVPFYKRELSLRRKKGPESVGVVEAVEPQALESDEVADEQLAPKQPVGFAAAPDDGEVAVEEAEDAVETDEPTADAVVAPDPGDESVEAEPLVDEEHVVETVAESDHAHDAETEDAGIAADPVADADAQDTAGSEDVPEAHDGDLSGDGAPAKPSGTRGRGSVRARRGSGPKPSRPRARGGKPVVGLKIGSSQLAAAVVSGADGRHELLQLARTPLRAGIVADGEVRDPEALKVALKEFFEEHKLPRKQVRIGLSSNRIGVRTLDIVGIDDQERFDNAVRFKAHEVLPVSVHESVLDYRVVDERATENGEIAKRVLLVVAPRDQVQPYIDVAGAAGLGLGGVDLEALGLLRAFVEPQAFALRSSTDTATVVVAIGHESTTLLVAGGGACEFTRVFDWGGGTLQLAIAQELDVELTEAATVLHALSLAGPSTAELADEVRTRALDAVRTRLTPFARELVASLQFYQAQTESLGIGEIVITGGTSHLPGLADALHQMIGVSVRVGDPLARVVAAEAFAPEIEAAIGSLAVPIGLAIEDDPVRTVNLLPAELRGGARKRPSLLAVALPVAVAVPVVAMGFAFMQANGKVSDREADLGAVQAQIAALPEPTRPTIDPSLAGEQAVRATALASVLGGRVSWEGVFRDLGRVLPGDISLTRVAARLPVGGALPAAAVTPATPVAPQGIEIGGYTFDHAGVARLLARLSVLPSLTNVQLQSSTREKIGKKNVVRFVVMADLSQPGGAS